MPEAAIRTTFIVGFPGETDAEFKSLLDFTKEARLDRVGAFHFSREPGTPSYDLPVQIPHKTKKQRFDQLMRLQQGISHEINRSYLGKPIEVLIDEHRDDWSAGRSFRDAPEIDGLVFVAGHLQPGTIVEAVVNDATPYDLYGAAEGSPNGQKRQMVPLRMASPRAPQ